jgi:hypothetical protein
MTPRLGRLLDRGVVLVAGERDERQTLTNVLKKEQYLFATQAVSSGQPGHRRVNFGQAVSGAAIPLFVGIDKGFETSLVMLMILNKDRDQNRGIEERPQLSFPAVPIIAIAPGLLDGLLHRCG